MCWLSIHYGCRGGGTHTASVTEMADAPERIHKMAATTTHRYVSADRHESSQVTVDLRESSQVTVDLRESSHVTVDLPESSQVTVDLPESSHVTADLPVSSHVSAVHLESCHVTADRPEFCHVLSVAPRSSRSVLRYPSLVSSVRDAPLVSARTAGIPKPTHFNPPVPELILLSEALPMMGIALLRLGCVHHHRTAPGDGTRCSFSRGGSTCCRTSRSGGAHFSSLYGGGAQQCTLSLSCRSQRDCYYCRTSRGAATAAEPSEVSVVSTHQLFACPVTARRAVPEL